MRNVYDSLKWISLISTLFIGVSFFHFAQAQENSEALSAPSTSVEQTQESEVRTPAQDNSNQKEVKKTLSFEDELVEGSTTKPELFYLFQKKNFNYKRLIKLRENFLPEMRKTSEDLQRVRSSN